MLKYFSRSILAALLLLALALVPAFADSGTNVQQTATHLDAATGLYGPAGGATACSTVNTTVANNTVTVPASGASYFYMTGIEIDITGDATGTTGVATLSTTNITGSPFWSLATLAVATGSGGGGIRSYRGVYPNGLKSAAPGTAVTFVPSAQIANQIVCIRVAGYYGS